MEKRWRFLKHDYDQVKALSSELNVTPLIAALLIARGFDSPETAKKFLSPDISHLHDPEKLKGLAEAVVRINKAVASGEKIMIWGDYDVDGTTGTVLLRQVLRLLGSESEFHIPNRFTEGYGINTPALEAAKARRRVARDQVDCGIRSFEPLEWAQANGIDVIVTDHHLTDPVHGNPPAFAIVNPNQTGCEYPDKHLAGVGVAFKLAQRFAANSRSRRRDQKPARDRCGRNRRGRYEADGREPGDRCSRTSGPAQGKELGTQGADGGRRLHVRYD